MVMKECLYAIFVLFLLVLAGCQTVNVCVDDGYCSTRERSNGGVCTDCIEGPFLPKSFGDLDYFSQADLEDAFGSQTAQNVAQTYINRDSVLYSLYAKRVSDVLVYDAQKTSVIVSQHDLERSARSTIDMLIGEKYAGFEWSLYTYQDKVYYYAISEGTVTEELVLFMADTDVYFIISENNDESSSIVTEYLKKYATDDTVRTEVLEDILSPTMKLPQDVSLAASFVGLDSTTLNSANVFRILDVKPSKSITDVAFSFQIPKEWVNSRVSSPEQITVLLSNDGIAWENIGATYVSNSGNYYTYKTIIPHFSFIGIGTVEMQVVGDIELSTCANGVYDVFTETCVSTTETCDDDEVFDSAKGYCVDLICAENEVFNADIGVCVKYIADCTVEQASNYNALATVDDGSCIMFESEDVLGCTDANALTYDPEATLAYPQACEYACELGKFYASEFNECQSLSTLSTFFEPPPSPSPESSTTKSVDSNDLDLGDTDESGNTPDGSLFPDDRQGEMTDEIDDPFADESDEENTNPEDVSDDKSYVEGCTDPAATNFNPAAEVYDGSCDYATDDIILGCTDESAINYESEANYNPAHMQLCMYECLEPQNIPVNGFECGYEPEAGSLLWSITHDKNTAWQPAPNNDCRVGLTGSYRSCQFRCPDNYEAIEKDGSYICEPTFCDDPYARNFLHEFEIDPLDGSFVTEPGAEHATGRCEYDCSAETLPDLKTIDFICSDFTYNDDTSAWNYEALSQSDVCNSPEPMCQFKCADGHKPVYYPDDEGWVCEPKVGCMLKEDLNYDPEAIEHDESYCYGMSEDYDWDESYCDNPEAFNYEENPPLYGYPDEESCILECSIGGPLWDSKSGEMIWRTDDAWDKFNTIEILRENEFENVVEELARDALQNVIGPPAQGASVEEQKRIQKIVYADFLEQNNIVPGTAKYDYYIDGAFGPNSMKMLRKYNSQFKANICSFTSAQTSYFYTPMSTDPYGTPMRTEPYLDTDRMYKFYEEIIQYEDGESGQHILDLQKLVYGNKISKENIAPGSSTYNALLDGVYGANTEREWLKYMSINGEYLNTHYLSRVDFKETNFMRLVNLIGSGLIQDLDARADHPAYDNVEHTYCPWQIVTPDGRAEDYSFAKHEFGVVTLSSKPVGIIHDTGEEGSQLSYDSGIYVQNGLDVTKEDKDVLREASRFISKSSRCGKTARHCALGYFNRTSGIGDAWTQAEYLRNRAGGFSVKKVSDLKRGDWLFMGSKESSAYWKAQKRGTGPFGPETTHVVRIIDNNNGNPIMAHQFGSKFYMETVSAFLTRYPSYYLTEGVRTRAFVTGNSADSYQVVFPKIDKNLEIESTLNIGSVTASPHYTLGDVVFIPVVERLTGDTVYIKGKVTDIDPTLKRNDQFSIFMGPGLRNFEPIGSGHLGVTGGANGAMPLYDHIAGDIAVISGNGCK